MANENTQSIGLDALYNSWNENTIKTLNGLASITTPLTKTENLDGWDGELILNEVVIQNLDELRNNFVGYKLLDYFISGKLEKWLENKGYVDKAQFFNHIILAQDSTRVSMTLFLYSYLVENKISKPILYSLVSADIWNLLERERVKYLDPRIAVYDILITMFTDLSENERANLEALNKRWNLETEKLDLAQKDIYQSMSKYTDNDDELSQFVSRQFPQYLLKKECVLMGKVGEYFNLCIPPAKIAETEERIRKLMQKADELANKSYC